MDEKKMNMLFEANYQKGLADGMIKAIAMMDAVIMENNKTSNVTEDRSQEEEKSNPSEKKKEIEK